MIPWWPLLQVEEDDVAEFVMQVVDGVEDRPKSRWFGLRTLQRRKTSTPPHAHAEDNLEILPISILDFHLRFLDVLDHPPPK